MILRGVVAIIWLCLFCDSFVFAGQTDLKVNITAASLKKNTAPITVSSDSRLVREHLRKHKSAQSVNSKKIKPVMASGAEAKVTDSKKIRKKKTEPEVIQLEIPEQLLKIVNTGKSFVFQDITRRDKEAGGKVDDLARRRQNIESLRQASVRR